MKAIVLSTAATTLLSLIAPSAALSRGLAWAVDNRFAPTLGNLPRINWYYHWADPVVPEMPGKVQFVPMYWGPKTKGKWETVKAYMNKHQPEYLLAFNEPELAGQANMDPVYAAQEFVDEILPWGRRGVKLGSPAIAFDVDWLEQFLKELKNRGGWVNFVACHWYGKHTEFEKFKAQITKVHERTGYDIWVTEVGLGAHDGYFPTESQAQEFAAQAFGWMESQPYIKRAAWFGSFQQDNTPDAFGKPANAFFKSGSGPKLTSLAYWYGNTGNSSPEPAPSNDDKDNEPSKGGDDKTPSKNNNSDSKTSSASPAKSTTTTKRKCKRSHRPAGKNQNQNRKRHASASRIGALLMHKRLNASL